MNIKKVVGKKIQEYRKFKDITQEQLAEIIGIDTISVSKIETGRNYPTAENLTKIAKILDVEIYELFIDNHSKSNDELMRIINKKLKLISNNNKKLHVLHSMLQTLI